jgi:hypothetical protein
VECTTRTGDIILASYRDATLLNNPDGAKRAIMRAHDTAVGILQKAGIYAP